MMIRRIAFARYSVVLCLWLACFATSPPCILAQQPEPDAFVYILNLGIRDNKIVYNGLRVGFAVGDGRTILTAAHCVEDFCNSNHSLFKPLVISRYYGDIFEAEIVDNDKHNDIALLRPAWDSHPGLRIETGDRWKKARKIVIAGYQPSDLAQGGSTKISRWRSLKEENVVSTGGEGRYAFQLGSVRYPGKGWSGSAFVLPDTDSVVGILSNERYERKFFLKRHYIFGCNPEPINSLYQRNGLPLSMPSRLIAGKDSAEQFDSILQLFDCVLTEDREKSWEIAKKLCQTCPDSYIIQIVAAWLLDTPSDEEYYQRAIELATSRPLPHAAYGSYLLNHDKPKHALRQFQSAVAIDPNNVFAQTGRIVALTQTNPAEAEKQGYELIETWPTNGGYWFELSRALRKQQKFQQELPILRKAIELPHPEHLEHLYQRHFADSLTHNGKYPEAEKAYKITLKQHPCARCWSAYTLLLIRMGSKRTEDAKHAFENVKSMNKDNSVPLETIRNYENVINRMTASKSSER